jgi:hypothetical protein
MGDKLCCEGQRKKNKYNPSIDLERSMLFEGVACAKLLAEVGGQSVAVSPPFANYLEDGYLMEAAGWKLC